MAMTTRVLHVVASRQRRGAEVFAVQLAAHLNPDRFESSVCFLNGLPEDGVDTSATPSFSLVAGRCHGIRKSLLATVRLVKLVRRLEPDVILAHGSDTMRFVGVLRTLRRRPRAIYRNIGIASYWARSREARWLYSRFARRFDAIVSLSASTAEDFARHYRVPPERIRVIPNAVDVAPFDSLDRVEARASVRREIGLRPDDVTLVTVGSLSPEKNQLSLLRLVKHLREQHREAHLVLVGGGRMRADLERAVAASGLSDAVHLLGSRTDIPRVLAGADMFVLPSITESAPAALIEAGLSGLPSVAYDVGGIAQIVRHGETGLLVQEGKLDRFEAAVELLLRDPALCRKLGAAAAEVCRRKFDINTVARQYETVFGAVQAVENGRRQIQR